MADLVAQEALPPAFGEIVSSVYGPVAQRLQALRAQMARPVIVGVCGAQGSGKSTLAKFVQALLRERDVACAVLSLDDLYRTRAVRKALARAIHPLLASRGAPGTHDVELGLRVLDQLTCPGPLRDIAVPCFDKAVDDRRPRADWPVVTAPADVVILEGWCVGARPQSDEALLEPVNTLEAEEDRDGVWRRYVNAQLAGVYQTLFARLDHLVLLEAPDFGSVLAWRTLQERKLARRGAEADLDMVGVMSEGELSRFVMHFERLTRHMLEEAPARADVTISLDRAHIARALSFATALDALPKGLSQRG